MWDPAWYKMCTESTPVLMKTVCADLSGPVAGCEVFALIHSSVDKAWHSFSPGVCMYISIPK